MPPGIVSRESQFGMRKAFSNEAELSSALVPVRVDCCVGVFSNCHSQAETGLASYYGGRGHHGEMTLRTSHPAFRKRRDGNACWALNILPGQ